MNVPAIVLITGDDDTLVTEAVRAAVETALGDDDRSLALEELTEEEYRTDDHFEMARLVDAAQTPPFLTERRVVVGRHLGRFGDKDSVAPLVAYLTDPLDTTALIVVWEKGHAPVQQRLNPVPKSLMEAIDSAGGDVRKTAVGRGREGEQWLDANDYRLPSWNQLKRAILNEQIVVLREEMKAAMGKRLGFALRK